jgi:hypothetical protein
MKMTHVRQLVLNSLLVCCFASPLTLAQSDPQGQPYLSNATLAKKQHDISRMSGRVMLMMAKRHGITQIQGKDISIPSVPPSKEDRIHLLLADRPVGADPFIHENEPSIAVKPNNPNFLVAASHLLGNPSGKCGAFRSLDGGATWSGPVLLPLRFATDFCSDPVVRYAPDGSFVYASYLSVRPELSTADVLVTRSSNGVNWSFPKVAIRGADYDHDGLLDLPDKPWLDVHHFPNRSGANSQVYVTTTLFAANGDVHILFSRSSNFASSFSAPGFLATEPESSAIVLQGSRPIGGRDRDVLVCWYNSEADGWGPEVGGGGVFDIRCRTSSDFGVTFGGEFAAVDNMSFELPFFLGPRVGFAGAYHRWWGGMEPSMAITEDGVAHMVFAADPKPGQTRTSFEDGDIYYVRSPRPYSSWTPPAKISDDTRRRSQGYPTITAKKVSGGSVVVAFWEDHRNSVVDNELYDIFSDQTLPSWGADIRISDLSSFSDFVFIGDYIDSSASRVLSDRAVHVIWTDRSDKTSEFDLEDDIYNDRLDLP